jgi:uncharacterized protein
MARGIIIREQHFPGRAPIDAYGNGGFRFADMSHKGSILCLPSGIYGWDAKEGDAFTEELFAKVLAEAADIEVLLIGAGQDLVPVPKDLRAQFRDNRISADPMSTGSAVRTFNILLGENRAVAAALIAVE